MVIFFDWYANTVIEKEIGLKFGNLKVEQFTNHFFIYDELAGVNAEFDF